jgi:hypothetical protein
MNFFILFLPYWNCCSGEGRYVRLLKKKSGLLYDAAGNFPVIPPKTAHMDCKEALSIV